MLLLPTAHHQGQVQLRMARSWFILAGPADQVKRCAATVTAEQQLLKLPATLGRRAVGLLLGQVTEGRREPYAVRGCRNTQIHAPTDAYRHKFARHPRLI